MVQLFLNNRRYTTLPVIENIVTKRSLQTVVISMLFAQLEETLFGMRDDHYSFPVKRRANSVTSNSKQLGDLNQDIYLCNRCLLASRNILLEKAKERTRCVTSRNDG